MEKEFLKGVVRLISGKNDLIMSIERNLETSFEKALFEASISNLLDTYNPLRFNNFSYSLRELVRHVLSRLAPDKEVLNCSWYKNETLKTPNGITRKQRIIYSIQGGLIDKYVSDELGIDTSKISNNVRDVIANLNKHTHIEEDSFDISVDDQEIFVGETFSSVVALFDTIESLRKSVSDKLIEAVDEAVIHKTISDTVQEIDELASHSYIDEIETNKINIRIDSENVHITAHGTIYAELQWGSNSDVEKGNGIITKQSFPFTCLLYSSVEEPEIINSDAELVVDNSAWRIEPDPE